MKLALILVASNCQTSKPPGEFDGLALENLGLRWSWGERRYKGSCEVFPRRFNVTGSTSCLFDLLDVIPDTNLGLGMTLNGGREMRDRKQFVMAVNGVRYVPEPGHWIGSGLKDRQTVQLA
ncbi:hypothetical protein C8J56DRAFT_879738 [Mycena floridula]|nr:hypothetical protein C8J56DRAFT_879738 [Mycena floridula]